MRTLFFKCQLRESRWRLNYRVYFRRFKHWEFDSILIWSYISDQNPQFCKPHLHYFTSILNSKWNLILYGIIKTVLQFLLGSL